MDIEFKNHSKLTKKEKKSKLFWKNSRLIKKGLAVVKTPKLIRIKPRGLTRAQKLEILLEKREIERAELEEKQALELEEKLKAEKSNKPPEVLEFDCTNIAFPCQLFISNLTSKTTKQLLSEHFQGLVSAEDIQLPVDKKTKKARGFGFINIPTDIILKQVMKLKDLKFKDQELTIKVKGQEV